MEFKRHSDGRMMRVRLTGLNFGRFPWRECASRAREPGACEQERDGLSFYLSCLGTVVSFGPEISIWAIRADWTADFLMQPDYGGSRFREDWTGLVGEQRVAGFSRRRMVKMKLSGIGRSRGFGLCIA